MQKEFLILNGMYIQNKLSFKKNFCLLLPVGMTITISPLGSGQLDFFDLDFFSFHEDHILFFIIFRGCEIMKWFLDSIKRHAVMNMGKRVWISEMSQVMGLPMLQAICTLFGITCFKMSATSSCFCPKSSHMCVCVCVCTRTYVCAWL